MKRSLFLLIVAVFSVFSGCTLLFFPNIVIEGNLWISSPQIEFLFRLLGGLIISIGIVNFLVRNHAGSDTLKAILILNISNHLINIINDFLSFNQEIANFQDSIPFVIGHLFIGLGSLYYLLKMKNGNA